MKNLTCIACNNNFNITISNGFVCSVCKYLNPLSAGEIDSLQGVNYFNYLFLPVNSVVNLDTLETNFLQLMQVYHPDKHVAKNTDQHLIALQHTNYLNTAYTTLQNFMQTFIYFYKLHNGVDILSEQDTASKTMAMEFFDLYEVMDEVTTTEQKNQFIKMVNARWQEVQKLLLSKPITNTAEVKNVFFKLKYVNTILQKAKNLVVT